MIQAGLLKHIEQRRNQSGSEGQLFNDIKYDPSNHWIKETSRWFVGDSEKVGYLGTLNLNNPERKCFHSFRHTVISHLRNKGVSLSDTAALVGHETGLTSDAYGLYELSILQKIVEQIQYSLDLTHLNYTRFLDYQRCKGQPNKNGIYCGRNENNPCEIEQNPRF